MRVTNATTYRNFTASVNNVHLALNKSMNKISSGEAYEKASESPLSYYEGQKIDNQYQETISKLALIKDVNNRVYQQELGARTIQGVLSNAGGAKNQIQFARTETTSADALQTTRDDLFQKAHEIADALNTQYQDYYVYGGNDYTTPPFSLTGDGSDTDPLTLTYTHKFPGDKTNSQVVFKMTRNDADGSYGFKVDSSVPAGDAINILKRAMSEQGRIDIGYGTISHRDTLVDTYSGGLNILTGISSDSAEVNPPATGTLTLEAFEEKLSKSPLGLVAQSVQVIDRNINLTTGDGDGSAMDKQLGVILEEMTTAEHAIGSVYADLGNKYHLLENTETRLNNTKDTLTEQYKDKLGADPYEAIMEMYNNNYAYNAALKVGSQLMSSSLFDFVR